jgi:hypothetical protein
VAAVPIALKNPEENDTLRHQLHLHFHNQPKQDRIYTENAPKIKADNTVE